MKYGIHDKPHTIREWIGYTLQFVLSVLPATLLISRICGTDMAAGLVSAGLGTLVFLICTGFKVPVITSNSGATASAIIATLVLGNSVQKNFTGVVIGCFVMFVIYAAAALLVKRYGTHWITRLMPPLVSGTTVLVIGITLMSFIGTYAQVNGSYSLLGTLIALFVVEVTCLVAHYCKGILRTLPFLAGAAAGYALCVLLSALGCEGLIDTSQFRGMTLLSVPDFAFLHIDFAHFDWRTLPQIVLMFGMVSVAAMTEHIADITTVSAVTQTDLTRHLPQTLFGDGLSSFVGGLTGAQATTTYSEATGTIAVSGVASVWCFLSAAVTLCALSFITPFNRVIAALPNCVFAGLAILSYGAISNSGIRTIMNAKIDFGSNRNLFIFAAMLSVGASSLAVTCGSFSFSGVALSMVVGVLLNLLLKEESA